MKTRSTDVNVRRSNIRKTDIIRLRHVVEDPAEKLTRATGPFSYSSRAREQDPDGPATEVAMAVSRTGSDRDDEIQSDAAELLEISDRIRQALECPVCLDLNADLACCCPSGHALCTSCLVTLKASSVADTCPLCRSPMSTATGGPLTAMRLVLSLPLVNVACRHWRHGCRALMPVEAVARHEAGCEHSPYVRCLAAACLWLGTYDLLYGHVRGEHPEAVVGTEGDRLTVTDANTIKQNKRRVYLVTADRGNTLMWVLMSRKTRTYMQTGVFMVDSGRRPPPPLPPPQHQHQQHQQHHHQQQQHHHQQQQQQQQHHKQQLRTECGNARPTGMGYRLTYTDAETRCKERSQTCWVGRWPSLMADPGDCGGGGGGDAASYTTFKPRTGRVEVHWFKHTTGRCTRTPDSCVLVMDVARPS